MNDLIDNHTDICQTFGTLAELSTKVMHSMATTLYFLQVNNDLKDMGKERETSHSRYGFLAEDQMKTLRGKLVKEEVVTRDRYEIEETDVEELDKEDN